MFIKMHKELSQKYNSMKKDTETILKSPVGNK